MNYIIPSINLGLLSDTIAQLNRKAKRLNVAPITFNVVGASTRDTGTFYNVELCGVSPKLNGGWNFAATIEHTEHGNIIRALPNVIIPEHFRSVAKTCHHCNKIRSRKDTYLVINSVGEFKQVGRACVKAYLGGDSLEQIGFLATLIHDLDAITREESLGNNIPSLAYIIPFMELAAETIIRYGFVSASAAKAYAATGALNVLETTASRAWEQIFPDRTRKLYYPHLYYNASEVAIKLASDAIAYAQGLPATSDYNYNLSIAAKKTEITRRDIGLLASAISSYQKHLGQEKLRQAKIKQFENSVFLGVIGERQDFDVTVISENVFATHYGNTSLYRMQDNDGNLLVWFSSGHKLDVGHSYCLKATVKDHKPYKSINQTVLTRCKVI